MTPETLAQIFAATLEGRTAVFDGEVVWPNARLRLRTYIGDEDWPLLLATSARAVVLRGRQVVIVRDANGERHVQPGGRIELGETPENAVRREVREETGWTISEPMPLGFHHFQHLGERSVDFAYPWRDFVQPLFTAEALTYDRAARDRSQIELGSRLTPIARALRELEPRQADLLRAAAAARAPGG